MNEDMKPIHAAIERYMESSRTLRTAQALDMPLDAAEMAVRLNREAVEEEIRIYGSKCAVAAFARARA